MENIQISIAENGTTTLATAEKFCDRNINVQVEVPTFEEELEARREIEDGLLVNQLTEYYNDRITAQIRANGFRDLTKLQRVKIPKASINGTNTFCDCSALEIVECGRDVGYQTFNSCTALKAVLFVGTTRTHMWTTNSFYGSGIEAGTGFVYVPPQLVESYKAHTNWALFASQIYPFVNTREDLSAIDGAVYSRCWVRAEDKAYLYDGTAWAEVTE